MVKSMTFCGDYQLYRYHFASEDPIHRISHQYVFETVAECVPSLSRVSSVPDLLELLSGDKEATTKIVVAISAMFGGNLIARGQWRELLSFLIVFLIVGVFHMPVLARTTSLVLVCYFVNSLKTDGVSVEWAVPSTNQSSMCQCCGCV